MLSIIVIILAHNRPFRFRRLHYFLFIQNSKEVEIMILTALSALLSLFMLAEMLSPAKYRTHAA